MFFVRVNWGGLLGWVHRTRGIYARIKEATLALRAIFIVAHHARDQAPTHPCFCRSIVRHRRDRVQTIEDASEFSFYTVSVYCSDW